MLSLIQTNTLDAEPRCGPDRVMPDQIFIVADDLTGACDSAVAFAASGRPVRVILDVSSFESSQFRQADGQRAAWAFTTESRCLPLEQARERVSSRIATLRPTLPRSILFQKVDSAGRGHFGIEISTALRSSVAALALVAPAFPEAGRTVQFGNLNVRDWSGQDTAISLRDLFPHDDAALVDLLPACSTKQLRLSIERALGNGTRILLCDAIVQEDLERLVEAALYLQQILLWAGSAGLAHALAGKLPEIHPPTVLPTPIRAGHALLFAGTLHPITEHQLSRLENSPEAPARAIHRIDWNAAPQSQVIAAFTAQPVSSLVLTGGETAAFVLRLLGASSILLAGEIARGIPWGFIEGGLADGRLVVTKSGGFGERDALAHAFEFCERRSRGAA